MTAVVLDFDPRVMVRADDGADGEGAAGEARSAVLGGEFGSAQDYVVCSRTAVEDCAQVGADSADVLSGAWVGGLGGA